MKRDTIQGLIAAIQALQGGLTSYQDRTARDARQQQYDKYAANDETRAAERHKMAMEGDKQKSPVDRLLKIGSSLSTTDEARAKAAQTFAMANGDADKSIEALSAEMEKLKMSAPLEPDAMAKEEIDYDPSAYKEAAKSHSKAMADLEQAIATLSAFRLDNQGAPQPGPMAAPGQQPSPMPASAPTPGQAQSLASRQAVVAELMAALQNDPMKQYMSQRNTGNRLPVKVAPLVNPQQQQAVGQAQHGAAWPLVQSLQGGQQQPQQQPQTGNPYNPLRDFLKIVPLLQKGGREPQQEPQEPKQRVGRTGRSEPRRPYR